MEQIDAAIMLTLIMITLFILSRPLVRWLDKNEFPDDNQNM